jgi:preprotein translocase subunit SecA
MLNVFKKIFGTKNDRELKRIRPLVQRCNELEAEVGALSEAQLRAKTDEFRDRLREATAGERQILDDLRALRQREAENPTPENEDRDLRKEIEDQDKQVRGIEASVLDEILPEAFAVVREASKRTTGLRHYDVQLIGGAVLHEGKIAEMKTGEGKTLVATLPLYLNALTGRGCHLVTVNDYLARRDVQWMGPIFHALGVSVASIVHEASYLFDPSYVVNDYRMLSLRPIERKAAYNADITYGTNHEFGFDYLRDNMKFTLEEYVQRELNYAIVDEVDNILIDEARTPLIISGPAEDSTDKYYHIDRIIPRLKKGIRIERKGDVPAEESGDFWVDEKARSAVLTESGVAKVERLLGVANLYDPSHIDLLHHTNQALKAHAIFKRDVDYIVKDGQVIIVDEFTGRLMPGRRWSDGLHQAVEAKEGVRIERENQTLATITIQNYFRMYQKLAGMTGTADTESVEFKNIYKLDVVVIPPNRPMSRDDKPDIVYKSEREKFNAVVDEVADAHKRGQPVLVGTVSVEKSEQLAKLLKRKGIRHNVLNAVNHEAEASVIAQAGRHHAVTIATNMAGRGTDILLGGNPEFLARADMENEWIKRSAKLPKGEQRFEESLQKLRERYEETVQKARAEFEPKWRPYEEKQAEALEKLTESHRAYLEAAFWEARAKYEQQLAELAQHPGPMRARNCGEAVARYSDALQEVDRIAGPFFGDEGQQRYAQALAHFREALGMTNDGAAEVAGARAEFERARGDYERAVRKGLSSADGRGTDFNSARRAYEENEREFKEAETAYLEHRKPFEETSLRAREQYERERREYAKAIEDVREEMDKAPHEFSERYGEILGHYRGICEQEREQVRAAGGLYIIGTERHESRRIDNQLRGRAGRQGDPGSSRFYLSLEDDLLRIFGAERIQPLMDRMGMEEGEPIEHRLISRAVANAQSKVEGRNFDIRKHLLEYDDVLNQQREIVYGRRRDVLADANLKQEVLVMAENVAAGTVERFTPQEVAPEEWDWEIFNESLVRAFNIRLQLTEEEKQSATTEELTEAVIEQVHAAYAAREQAFTPPVQRQLEKMMMLQTLDALWKDHLLSMDHLKEGINLRGYGQKNPLTEYKKEGFEMFEGMMTRLENDVVEKVFTVQVARQEDIQRIQQQRRPQPAQMVMSGGGSAAPAQRATVKRDGDKTGRNDPCPCGSGKKYKKCHGS